MINADDLNMFNPGQNQSHIMDNTHESEREMQEQRGNFEKDQAEVSSLYESTSFRRRWRTGQWERPGVLLEQSTMQTDCVITSYLARSITSHHMSPVSFCLPERICLTESVSGHPAQTP